MPHGQCDSVFSSHNQHIQSAHPKLFRSEMPSPLSSRGCVTFPQATRQCPPFTSFLPQPTDAEPLNDATRYCQLVGSLVYLGITRPDISHSSYPVCLSSYSAPLCSPPSGSLTPSWNYLSPPSLSSLQVTLMRKWIVITLIIAPSWLIVCLLDVFPL
jgi:hypothetical protein